MKRLAVVGLVAAVFGLLTVGALAATNIHLATLNGSASFPAVNGKAKFQVDDGVRELDVELQDACALRGRTLNVFAKGQKVGTIFVNNLCRADKEFRGSVVPRIQTGDTIRIRTQGGTLVASGRFN